MRANQSRSYSPLLPNNIRLLRVNEDILALNAGSLEVLALDVAPPYYALSHSWGTQHQNIALQIEGQVLCVSPDLAAGIRRLRELAAEGSKLDPPVRYVWIDNICINQKDILERSSNVKLMGKIYSQSIRTLIWLGPKIGSCAIAWQLVDHIYSIFRAQHPAAKVLVDIPVKMYSDSSHFNSGLPQWDNEVWVHLRQLMGLRWFSRIWVIQEVILSQQDPIIIHGDHLYPWHRLGWAAAWMRRNGYIRLAQIPEEIRNVDTICNIRRSQTKWPLGALMSITQIKFHATDQRDKIYGLLGLAAECQDTSKLPVSLRPDYGISVTQVYQQVARFLLEDKCSLAILTRTRGMSGSLTRKQRQYEFTDVPSWVPDWSDFRVFNRGIRTSLSWIDYSDTSKRPRLGYPKHYIASAGLELKLYSTVDSSVLRVSGMRLQKVVRVLPFNKENSSNQEFKRHFALPLARVCEAAISLLAEGHMLSWTNQFIKATTAEQHFLSGRAWDQSFKDGLAYLHDLLLVNEVQMSFFISKSGNKNAMALLRHLSDGGEPEEYAALTGNYCFSRSFMITSAGQMGIGPSNTRIGDTVSVIPGGGVPYIIRQQGTSWAFVGESYVQGLMNGEAIQAYRQGIVQEEILEIR